MKASMLSQIAPRPVAIASISEDPRSQIRVATSTSVAEDYASSMESGVVFPPVVLFRDGGTHWIGDGWHRIAAARLLGLLEIQARVVKGTWKDARLHSIESNASHGFQLTRDEKRRAVNVLLDDPDQSGLSDREIAAICGVTHPTVSTLRKAKWDADGLERFGAEIEAEVAVSAGRTPEPERPSARTNPALVEMHNRGEAKARERIEAAREFYQMMAKIRDEKLYPAEYPTFAAYLKSVWGLDELRAA